MPKWTIVNGGSGDADQIGKDGVFYDNIDLSFLPSDVLAVQSEDGVTCDIEHGNPATGWSTTYQSDVATSTLSWWSSVDAAWQARYNDSIATELTALSVAEGTLSPVFSSSVLEYDLPVSNSVTSVSVTATARDSGATVEVHHNNNLQVGENSVYVTCTKSNCPNRAYVINVIRAAS
jgi:hypothetical protein